LYVRSNGKYQDPPTLLSPPLMGEQTLSTMPPQTPPYNNIPSWESQSTHPSSSFSEPMPWGSDY
jgi:hypothetical protein